MWPVSGENPHDLTARLKRSRICSIYLAKKIYMFSVCTLTCRLIFKTVFFILLTHPFLTVLSSWRWGWPRSTASSAAPCSASSSLRQSIYRPPALSWEFLKSRTGIAWGLVGGKGRRPIATNNFQDPAMRAQAWRVRRSSSVFPLYCLLLSPACLLLFPD